MTEAVIRYHQNHSCPVANYDMYFAKVFPDLQPYVERNLTKEPCIPIGNTDIEEIWTILKNKIINDSFVLPHADEVRGKTNIKWKIYKKVENSTGDQRSPVIILSF